MKYLPFSGHNTDGKYFVSSNKLAYSSETRPRRIHVFTEKGRDGHVTPVNDVEIDDIACGLNHAVRNLTFNLGVEQYVVIEARH